ncbi:MAG TPA: imidazolonepropionase [Polyangiaceae bacterium]|nr:imidazolonepropionase [Polyangiaceae bacterium]
MSARVFEAARIVTCDPQRPGALGVVSPGVIVVDAGRVAFVGPPEQAPLLPPTTPRVVLGDRVVTPGLIDAHTHACWVGSRHDEYARRLAGADYRAIASAGGGIQATYRAVASSTEQELADVLSDRLRRMARLGVTTVEVKSGYGLEANHERKQLLAIARAAREHGVPSVVPTLLALHALPPGVSDRAAYVAGVADRLVPEVAHDRLASFVDAYVDADAFRVTEARVVAEAALKAGLGVRLHVGQFADVGGASLAASLAASSADHLEHVSPAGLDELARAGVTAVLLPVASFTLAQAAPEVDAMRRAGVRLVVASDANPGTAPTESLPLALALAARCYGLTPDEALLAATRNAAAALRLDDRGILRAGLRADLVVWDFPHEHAIVAPWGTSKAFEVLVAGSAPTPASAPEKITERQDGGR